MIPDFYEANKPTLQPLSYTKHAQAMRINALESMHRAHPSPLRRKDMLRSVGANRNTIISVVRSLQEKGLVHSSAKGLYALTRSGYSFTSRWFKKHNEVEILKEVAGALELDKGAISFVVYASRGRHNNHACQLFLILDGEPVAMDSLKIFRKIKESKNKKLLKSYCDHYQISFDPV